MIARGHLPAGRESTKKTVIQRILSAPLAVRPLQRRVGAFRADIVEAATTTQKTKQNTRTILARARHTASIY
jgi:hypothetical protein